MLSEEKALTISKIYFDEAGFGSMRTTYNDAKKEDPTIKYEDVVEWFQNNVEKKTNLKGYNSFVPSKPQDEYQADLFFILDLPNQKYTIGLLMIDAFTKFMQVVPIGSKKMADILAGIMEACKNMKGYPKIIYTDEEGGINTNDVIEFLEKKGTRLVTTRTHAAIAERAIRTFKSMLYKRIDASKAENPQWIDVLPYVLVTYNYKLKHSSIGMTPDEARQDKNFLNAKISLELKAKHNRKYPPLAVGDYVKIFFKKKRGEKERVSYWSDTKHKVVRISEYLDQPYYHLEGITRPYLRFELLKTN
jgi:hypothetical protein